MVFQNSNWCKYTDRDKVLDGLVFQKEPKFYAIDFRVDQEYQWGCDEPRANTMLKKCKSVARLDENPRRRKMKPKTNACWNKAFAAIKRVELYRARSPPLRSQGFEVGGRSDSAVCEE